VIGEAEALHELDVAQRFGGRPGQRRRLGHDHLLNGFHPPTQSPAQYAQQRNRRQERGHDDPVHRKRVEDDEHDADQSRENEIDRQRDEFLDVGPHFLELAQRLAASLVLKDGIRQLQRVPDAVRIHLGAHTLDDDVDVIVLEVLGDARHESDAHCHQQQRSRALDECRRLVFAEACRVVVDHVPEDERVQQRENLVGCRQHEREKDQPAVFAQVRGKEVHNRILLGRGKGRNLDRMR